MRATIYTVLLALATSCSVPDFYLVDAGSASDDSGTDSAADDGGTDAAVDAPPGAARITNVTSSAANDLYAASAAIPIQVVFNQPVTVNTTGGTPSLTLNTGASAIYMAGTGTATLTFTYMVEAGHLTPDLDYAANDSLKRNGGTIENAASDLADLELPTPGGAGSLGANKDIAIDAVVPVVSAITGPAMYVSSSSASLTYSIDETNLGATACMQTAGTGTMTSCTESGAMFTGLSQGAHSVAITHTDLAGNVSAVRTHSWIVDTVNPTISTITGPNMYAASTSASLSYSVSDANPGMTMCTHTTGTGTTSSCSATGASFTGLSQGAHTITITHTDLAGNMTAKTYSWTVDTTVPVVSAITGPAAFSPSKTATLAYSVSDANPGSTSCTQTTGTGTVSSCTATGATLTGLSEGPHTVSVVHADLAGNTSAVKTYSWTVDTIAPVVSAISGPSSVTTTTDATLTYSITETNLGTTTCDHTLGTGTEISCTDAKVVYDALSPGTHTVTITHKDRAGNVSAAKTYSWSSCPQISFGPSTGTSFTVPDGCGTVMEIYAWGGGGAEPENGGAKGGGAAFASGRLTVSAGQVFTVSVGGGGFYEQGGTNGGGTAGIDNTAGGGGGGWSGVSMGGVRYVVAAGGGGAGECGTGTGGVGGGTSGGAGGGGGGTYGAAGGKGATQTAPGAGGGNGAAGVGSTGGHGAAGLCSAGGGGGGYFGGGGGGSPNLNAGAGGGGGGSSFVHSSVASPSIQSGSGQSPGGNTLTLYVGGVGVGGGTKGGPGRVILYVRP